jgi:hypothetical protein
MIVVEGRSESVVVYELQCVKQSNCVHRLGYICEQRNLATVNTFKLRYIYQSITFPVKRTGFGDLTQFIRLPTKRDLINRLHFLTRVQDLTSSGIYEGPVFRGRYSCSPGPLSLQH